jgi:AcrR family transcriptional regulator
MKNRDRIIKACMELIRLRGLTGFTMDELAYPAVV